MRVNVELFGIPRRRAGVSRVEIDLPTRSTTVAEVLARLLESYPDLEREVLSARVAPTTGGEPGNTLPADSLDDTPVNVPSDSAPDRRPLNLAAHCLLQVHGVFTRDTSAELQDGDQLLLLSADAGG